MASARQLPRFGPTHRGGPVFRWLGEPLAIDLVNTVMVVRDGELEDLVATNAGMAQWLDAEADRVGDLPGVREDPERLRAFRDAVRAALVAVADGTSPPRDAVRVINAASAAAPVSSQLTDAPGALLAIEHVPEPRDTETEFYGVLARSAIAVIDARPQVPLNVCRAPSCGMLFQGARKWCCLACGNRARAANHYERTRARKAGARQHTAA